MAVNGTNALSSVKALSQSIRELLSPAFSTKIPKDLFAELMSTYVGLVEASKSNNNIASTRRSHELARKAQLIIDQIKEKAQQKLSPEFIKTAKKIIKINPNRIIPPVA